MTGFLWAPVIFGGSVFAFVDVGLSETARSIGRNGSLEATGWGRTWWRLLQGRTNTESDTTKRMTMRKTLDKEKKTGNPGLRKESQVQDGESTGRNPSPLLAGSPHAVWYAVQASIPPIYEGHLPLQRSANRSVLPLRRLWHRHRRLLEQQAEWTGTTAPQPDRSTTQSIESPSTILTTSSMEQARARGSYYLLAIYTASHAGNDWSRPGAYPRSRTINPIVRPRSTLYHFPTKNPTRSS